MQQKSDKPPPLPPAPFPWRKSISRTLCRNRSFPLGRLPSVAVNQSTQVHTRVTVVDAAKLLSHIFKTFSENKGVQLVFGRYSLPSSLKRDTWTKGQKGKEAQKTIKAGQQNRGWVVVVGGQNAWEQEKIFLAPKQTRGGRCRDYFTCHGCYSQSYDILSTQRFTSWLSDIIQVFASTPFVTSTWRNHQEIILWEKKRKWS